MDGQLTFNGSLATMRAALAGFGLACVPLDMALPHIAQGHLVQVLADWAPTFPGYHIYYPSRRASPALAALVAALRYPPEENDGPRKFQ